MYGQLITDSLRTVAKTIMQDLSDGNPEESYIAPGNYDRMMDLYEDLSHFSEVSSDLMLFRGKLGKYYSIFREIKRVQEQAAFLNIGSYEEWTNMRGIIFAIEKLCGKIDNKIEKRKEKYVKALAEAIQSVASMWRAASLTPKSRSSIAFPSAGSRTSCRIFTKSYSYPDGTNSQDSFFSQYRLKKT